MRPRRFITILTLFLGLATFGCAGQGGDGAGAAIVGQPIGGDAALASLPFARVSLNASDIFAVSSQSGQYTIPGVPKGTYTLRVSKWNTPIVTLPFTADADTMPIVDLGRINQAAESTITLTWPTLGIGSNGVAGRVVDTEGNGVNEVEILVTYANGAFARAITQPNTADPPENEFFALGNLPDNPVRLIAGQDGFRPLVIERPFDNLPRVGNTFETGDLMLRSLLPVGSDPAMAVVAVVDLEGNPLSGIPVNISLVDPELNPIDRFGIGGITGSDGRWSFAGVPGAETYQLWAGSGAYFPATQSVELVAGVQQVITLTLHPKNGTLHPYFTGG